MKITVIGKTGCSKCSKMSLILKDRGYDITSIYVDGPGSIEVEGAKFDIPPETHFPLYYYNNVVYMSYKELNDSIIQDIRKEEP